jgi:hypothetical protein
MTNSSDEILEDAVAKAIMNVILGNPDNVILGPDIWDFDACAEAAIRAYQSTVNAVEPCPEDDYDIGGVSHELLKENFPEAATRKKVIHILKKYLTGKVVASTFGVSIDTVKRIWCGRDYPHLTPPTTYAIKHPRHGISRD